MDQNQEKSKKTKTKAPIILVTKNRQTYLQNLEKKLDETMTSSADQKKFDKRANMTNNSPQNPGLSKLNAASKSQVGFGIQVQACFYV